MTDRPDLNDISSDAASTPSTNLITAPSTLSPTPSTSTMNLDFSTQLVTPEQLCPFPKAPARKGRGDQPPKNSRRCIK